MPAPRFPEAVYARLNQLVRLLDRIAASGGPDASLAIRAAANIRVTREELDAAGDEGSVRAALLRIRYDVGGKGIHDWIWSPATERELRRYTEGIRLAWMW